MAQLSEDTELHDGLLAAGQRQSNIAASPPAVEPKKRKLSEETPLPEANKVAKTSDEVSPTSISAALE